MRLKHKKTYISGIAVTLAGVLGAGALLQSGLSVQASPAMMPGIEEIIKDKGTVTPFRILEIVDEKKDAEIGWYVSGQEPYIKLYEYTTKDGQKIHFSNLKEGLEKLPGKELREEFAKNISIEIDANGTRTEKKGVVKDVQGVCYKPGVTVPEPADPVSDYPLSYSDYQEKYFLSPDDAGWSRVDFLDFSNKNRIDKVTLNGQYIPNPSGTGDYTKQQQNYYPIRQTTNDGSNKQDKYRENIKDLFFLEGTGATAPYHLEFAEVQNETVNQVLGTGQSVDPNNVIYQEYNYSNGRYGYYEKVYSNLTEDLAKNTSLYPGENPTITPQGILIQDNQSLLAAEVFSAGDISPFSSNEVQTEVIEEQPVMVEEQSIDGAFSDGESGEVFSSEMSDEPELSQQEEAISELDQAFAVPPIENMAVSQCLYEPLGQENAGTQIDPWVYMGNLIDQFPNYKYTLISDLEYVKQKAIEIAQRDEANKTVGEPIVRNKGDISLEKGQYFYWDENIEGRIDKTPLSIVTGYQPVDYKDIRPIYEQLGYNYYFRVSKAYFCCDISESGMVDNPEDYKYFGWYYPAFPQDESNYVPAGNNVPTHYISDAEFKLTEGIGDHDFVPGEGEGTKEWNVEVNHMFYRGGYTNHDWFKRYVFNLRPEVEDFKNLAIDVITVTPAEFEREFVNQAATMAFTDELVPVGADAGFTDDGVLLNVETEFADIPVSEENVTSNAQSVTGELEMSEGTEIVTETMEESSGISAEVVPVEPLISESQETALTGELFTDTAQMEDDAFISGEGTASDTNQINDSFEEEPAFETSENEAAFTSKATPAEPVKLSDFDLIYINGTLVTASATALAKSGIPCIINESKLQQLAGGVNELRNAFSSFIKDTDADSHYVTQYVYVFKNTLLEAGNSGIKPDGLLNLQFHQDFNSISDGTIPNDKIEGFEEILEYIDSENQYRQLGATQDKDGNYVDGAGNIIELLKMNLSQARAIEYILNFKHRRPLNKKDTINVLEIQPAKSNGQLTKNQVLRWLGYDPIEATVTACCEEKSGEEGGRQGHTKFIADGKLNTYWHSQYNGGNHANKSDHWITISYNHPVILNSLHYTPRFYGENKTANGEIFKFNLIFDDNSRIENCTWTQEQGKNYESYVLQQPKENVTSVKIEIIEAHDNGNKSKKYASCVELETEYSDIQSQASKYPKVDVTTMTSSEFVGHIEDINTKYDMIYWGDDETNLNQYANFRPDSYLYYHIGKADRAKGELQGLMNQDYEENGVNLSKLEGEIGLVRGSGNDITLQQKEKLMDFVHSGYPVVLGDILLNDTGVIDESRVDNSSYVYQFLKEAMTYQNVMTKETASKSTNLAFYMKISKPKIVFKDNGIPVSAIKDINGPSNQYLQGDGLVYSFHIEDDAAISPASTLYNCELYLDLNCDGNFSPKNERIKDIEIRQNGELLSRNSSGCYELKAGKENIYTVTRTVPQEYVKLITWKLEVSNNQNNYIRTSELGYTKRGRNHATSSVPEIKVLQIHPTKPGKDTVGLGDEGNTWDLTDQDFLKYFDVVQNEFHITIKGITIDNYNAIYNNVTKELQGFEYAGFNNLNDYDMLIIGFGDGEAYGNIDEDGVQGIEEFIKTGKSVIFAHDTTSSSVVKRNAKDTHQVGMWKGWAYNLNMKLRSVMGMDRYGITGSQKAPDSSEQISSILKQASSLASTDKTWDLIKNSAPDMAYEAGTGQTQTVGQTHGFTNAKLRIATKNHDGLADIQTKVTKVNEGAITKYPYKIDDMPGFDVAGTHAQYYQAALEADTDGDKCNDVVVWYCLDGGTYAESPNDVRNNYYIYSNKNVFYTGVGHRLVKEKGSEEEKKLFVNTIVAAYRASSVNPKIEFLDSYDMDAPEQEVVYYMTDQESYAKEPGNIINEGQEFYFRVKDNNLISTGIEADGERKMNIDLYISDSNGGTVEGINEKVSHLPETVLYQKTGKDTEAQVTHVSSGYVYRFRLQDMFEYLMDANNHYKNGVKLYAKVSTKYMYFGEEITASAVDQIDLCQRHLFDLD